MKNRLTIKTLHEYITKAVSSIFLVSCFVYFSKIINAYTEEYFERVFWFFLVFMALESLTYSLLELKGIKKKKEAINQKFDDELINSDETGDGPVS